MGDKRSLDNSKQLKKKPPNWPRRRDRVQPFSCGSQFADWEASNCEQCEKKYDEKTQRFKCELQRKIKYAYIDDGKIDISIAKRLGIPSKEYIWRCPELEKAH